MRIRIVTPAGAGSRAGNRVTALRWARLLRRLGHRVSVETAYARGGGDLLVAIHARKSGPSVRRWRAERPGAPVVVALAGTDVYPRLSRKAVAALESADRIVALQPLAVEEVPAGLRDRVRVILQSVPALSGVPPARTFRVLVLGHLRPVKDPFRAARAVRGLPAESRVSVVHAGAPHGARMAARARREEEAGSRYRWIGDVPRTRALDLLARSHLLVVPSRHEGGANVVSEAVAAGVPVLASRIPGSVGLLGGDYPGYFPVGDTAALRRLIRRAETDAAFYADLKRRIARLGARFAPEREEKEWAALLREVAPARSRRQNPRRQAWNRARAPVRSTR